MGDTDTSIRIDLVTFPLQLTPMDTRSRVDVVAQHGYNIF